MLSVVCVFAWVGVGGGGLLLMVGAALAIPCIQTSLAWYLWTFVVCILFSPVSSSRAIGEGLSRAVSEGRQHPRSTSRSVVTLLHQARNRNNVDA